MREEQLDWSQSKTFLVYLLNVDRCARDVVMCRTVIISVGMWRRQWRRLVSLRHIVTVISTTAISVVELECQRITVRSSTSRTDCCPLEGCLLVSMICCAALSSLELAVTSRAGTAAP